MTLTGRRFSTRNLEGMLPELKEIFEKKRAALSATDK